MALPPAERAWLGGEMELEPGACPVPPPAPASWPFKSFRTVLSGRTGIRLVLQALRGKMGGGFLLPSYLCKSMLQPFREEGVAVEFFRVRSDLGIDVEDLERLARQGGHGAVLFVNYFGFPPAPAARDALLGLKERLWVLEDCAHGSLLEQPDPAVGQIGDFVLTSLRKYLPVPDGGLVVNHTDLSLPELPASRSRFVRSRLVGKYLRHEFLKGGGRASELEAAYLFLFAAAEQELDDTTPLEDMSAVSASLLGAVDWTSVVGGRRRNFAFLLNAFTEDPRLRALGTPLFSSLPPRVSPLVFPLRIAGGRRDELRRQLALRRVFCPVHWQLPETVGEGPFGESFQLSRECLGLPIDQRYAEEQMGSLVERLL